MFLWKLTTEAGGYDSNDAVIVCAADATEAREAMKAEHVCRDECAGGYEHECTWRDPARSTCTRIGLADTTCPRGIVLRSYNAG